MIQGKVYNITAYLDFHPGGKKTLMQSAGKDGTALFSKNVVIVVKTHPWVNAHFLLDRCLVGFLRN